MFDLLPVRTRNVYTIECFRHFHKKDGTHCERPFECPHDHEQRLVWRDGFENVVVTVGLNALLGNTFDAAAGSVLWYVGLIGAGAGTVSITSGADAVTGSGTSFAAGDVGSDIMIVGAGATGADLITTVDAFTSGTSISVAANASATVSGANYAVEPRAADTMASKSFSETSPYSNGTRPAWTKNGAPSGGAMSNSSSKASFSINTTGRIFGAFMASDNTKGGTTGTLYGGGLFTASGSRAVVNGDTVNAQVDLSVTSA
jgi:hypothetical protein